MVLLRPYHPQDLPQILALFYQAVHTVCQKEYTPAQLDAWAPSQPDRETWERSLNAHFVRVAAEGGKILGFADLEEPDYFDRLYILPEALHTGLARELTAQMEGRAQQLGARRITVHASKTAMGFFLRQGYRVIREQRVERYGVSLTNYAMEKELPSP